MLRKPSFEEVHPPTSLGGGSGVERIDYRGSVAEDLRCWEDDNNFLAYSFPPIYL